VQAQDYSAAKWALGLRAPGLTDEDVEAACSDGRILRTHVLRPTWHFVTPADIRWMLALTGPRINKSSLLYCRTLGLDDTILRRSRVAIERALRDGTQLTRAAVGAALGRAGIKAHGPALAQVMMNAELEGVVCSGARQGKQFTYALLEERAPRVRTLTRDEALGALARRYFASHGPATLRDYVWWSGLVVGDARRGIEIAGTGLEREVVDERTYWSVPSTRTAAGKAAGAHLLPNYDEYLVAYRYRDAVVELPRRAGTTPRGSDVFAHSLIIEGRLAGSWTRTAGRDPVAVDVVSYRRLTPLDRRAVSAAAERYGRFLKQAVVCVQASAR
jgi:winged helix DNA-binding protein